MDGDEDRGRPQLTGMGPDETDGLGSGCLAWTVGTIVGIAAVAVVLAILLVTGVVPLPGRR